VIKERTRQAAAKFNAATAPAAGPLRPELVHLPDGSPEHEITVPFALAVTEVTQGQYRRVMGNLPQDA
jgi:formylglycine-generating enzyme required for sulfatase activity